MKKKVVTVILIICVCIVFSYMLYNRYSDYEKIEQRIMFICLYTNWAEGYMNHGHYIDKEGNKVEFDLSDKDEKYADISNLLEYLENQKAQKEKVHFRLKKWNSIMSGYVKLISIVWYRNSALLMILDKKSCMESVIENGQTNPKS